jgi:hypothetical protein
VAAPTFVSEYESFWNSNSQPKDISGVTVNNGDVLVIFGITEEAGSTTLTTPTGGGLTYTLQQSIVVSNYTAVYAWTAVASSSQTYTLSVGGSTTGWWGYNCLRFSGSAGVGASSKTNVANGAPSLGLTTTGANSAIVTANGDWQALDGTSRTPRSIGSGSYADQSYFRDINHYAIYGGYYTDAGTAGAKTVGWSAPGSQKYSIVAVEVLGSGAAAATSRSPLQSPWTRRVPLLVR